MQNEKMQVNLAPGMEKAEIIVREVKEVNELPVKAPIPLSINSTIGGVAEFLRKRIEAPDGQINIQRSHILVDRENIKITLVLNEDDYYKTGKIVSTLEYHPKFEEFGINSGFQWTPSELGMFFKMNRSFFINLNENQTLVNELMNFTATVNNSIQRSAKENGDKTDNFTQVVNSNLPSKFNLRMPIFKGLPAETIEVETFAKISGHEVSFVLLSPGANSTLETLRDNAIDEQLKVIREICPVLPIIEQ